MRSKLNFSIGEKISNKEALEFSLDLAQKGQGLVEPNPCVGAVLVDESSGELISFGWHTKFGKDHAEVEALKGIDNASGMKMFVTLEPCSHEGKTGPCCDLLIAKKLSKLIYIDQDPNPKVLGKGLEKLKRNGVMVEQAPEVYSQKNRSINKKFFHFFEKKRTHVQLKWAQSLDGKISLNNESKWITGEDSREMGQRLRAQNQMILVGRKTLLLDDPSLDVRIKGGYEKKMKLALLDPNLEILNSNKTFKAFKIRVPKDITFICKKRPKETAGFNFVELPLLKDSYLDLSSLPDILFKEQGIQGLYVEGGATTLGAFLSQKVYDQISIFIAPIFLGSKGSSPLDNFIVNSMKDKIAFSSVLRKLIGKDYFIDLS